MTLRQKQSLLVRCLQQLFTFAHAQGWEMTLGEAGVINPRKVLRSGGPTLLEDAEHMRGSLHYKRLAIDLNLFVRGRYIRSGKNPAYIKLGKFWEGLSPLCKWGGRFASGDANHFSITHGGKA